MSASTNSRRGCCAPASEMSKVLSCQPHSPRESKVSVTCRASPGAMGWESNSRDVHPQLRR